MARERMSKIQMLKSKKRIKPYKTGILTPREKISVIKSHLVKALNSITGLQKMYGERENHAEISRLSTIYGKIKEEMSKI